MKTLVKIKISISEDSRMVSIWHWQKTFWFFGYWYRYPYGLHQGYGLTEEEIAEIDVLNVSKAILHNVYPKSKTK